MVEHSYSTRSSQPLYMLFRAEAPSSPATGNIRLLARNKGKYGTTVKLPNMLEAVCLVDGAASALRTVHIFL